MAGEWRVFRLMEEQVLEASKLTMAVKPYFL